MQCPFHNSANAARLILNVSSLPKADLSLLDQKLPTDESEAKIQRHQILRLLIEDFLKYLGDKKLTCNFKSGNLGWSSNCEGFIEAWRNLLYEAHCEFEQGLRVSGNLAGRLLKHLQAVRLIDDPVGGYSITRGGMGTFIKFLASITLHLPARTVEAERRGENVQIDLVLNSTQTFAFRMMALNLFDLKTFAARYSYCPAYEGMQDRSDHFVKEAFEIRNNSLDLTLEASQLTEADISKERSRFPHIYLPKTYACPAAYARDNQGGRSIKGLISKFFEDFMTKLGQKMLEETQRLRN